jgi:hypothetical protein
MAYVTISDPNIIDLGAWHEVINVVNQHSNTLSAITDNFGASGSTVTGWNTDTDLAVSFVMGSQKIVYGRFKVNFKDDETATPRNNKNLYYGAIDFSGSTGSTGFAAIPIVTTTVQYGSQTIDTTSDATANTTCTIFGVSGSGFSFRVMNPRSVQGNPVPLPDNGHLYINWTAIGPK